MMKKPFGLLALAFGLCALPATSLASSVGWEFATLDNEHTPASWDFGEVFTVNQNIFVDFLGYYLPSTGMTASHEVALYDSLGNQLAHTVITSGSSFATDHFLFNTIAPIELFAGQTYVLQGLSSTDPFAWDNSGFQTYAPITILGNNAVNLNTLSFNGTNLVNDTDDGYWGANFGWDPVAAIPEPGSWTLAGTGLLLVAGTLRRKKKR